MDMDRNRLFVITAAACLALPEIVGLLAGWTQAHTERIMGLALLLVILKKQMGGKND